MRAMILRNTPRIQSCAFLSEIQPASMKSIEEINDDIVDSGDWSRIRISMSGVEIAPDVICKNH